MSATALLPGFPPIVAHAELILQYLGNAHRLVLSLQARRRGCPIGAPAVDVSMAAAELMEQGEEVLLDRLWAATRLDYRRLAEAAARFGDVKTMHRAMTSNGARFEMLGVRGISDAALLDLLGPRGKPLDAITCANSRSTEVLDMVAPHVINPTYIVQELVDFAPTYMVEHALALPGWKDKVGRIHTMRHTYDSDVQVALHGIQIGSITSKWKILMHDGGAASEPGCTLSHGCLDTALSRCFTTYPKCLGTVLGAYRVLSRTPPWFHASGNNLIFSNTASRLITNGVTKLCVCGDLGAIECILNSGDDTVRTAVLRAAKELLLPQVAALAAPLPAAGQ